MKLYASLGCLALGTLCLCQPSAVKADIIFNNSVNDLSTRFNPGTSEVGDEIILAGTASYLTNFSFEFYGVNTLGGSTYSGSPEARVRFYLNNGAPFNGYATPGTMFYDSGTFSLGSLTTSRSTLVFNAGTDFPAGGLFLPARDITWSVQFSGLGATDQAGVDLYSPPTVGQDYNDYWQNVGGANPWQLMTNNTSVSIDFGALFQASPVPEPTTLALLGLGAIGLFVIGKKLTTDGK